MLERLRDPALFVTAIQHVATKERDAHRDEPLLGEAPSAASLSHESRELAERLAKLVSSASYELSPVIPRRALIEGKWRVLFHSPPLDVIVLTALAEVMRELLEPGFSPHLYSYRRGFSPARALLDVSAYLREHRRARSDVRTRGVYVVRRDIKAYGDSIPSGKDARLWPMLKGALEAGRAELDPREWSFLQSALRPKVAETSDIEASSERGIPTGSPLQPVIGNLYLGELDRLLEQVEGGFYARFGDDILFMHPDANVAKRQAEQLDHMIGEHGLALNAGKSSALYLTAAGRAPADAWYRGTSSFKYLGMRIDARGERGISQDKATRLLRGIQKRLEHAHKLCPGDDFEARARLCCDITNAALDPAHPTADRAAQLLRHLVSDRSQLIDLDYQLALRIAQAVTGKRGVRAFRALPMRTLREGFGLRSLVVERNQRSRA